MECEACKNVHSVEEYMREIGEVLQGMVKIENQKRPALI